MLAGVVVAGGNVAAVLAGVVVAGGNVAAVLAGVANRVEDRIVQLSLMDRHQNLRKRIGFGRRVEVRAVRAPSAYHPHP